MFSKSRTNNQTAILVAIGLALSFALMGVWVRMMQGSFDTFQQSYLRVLLAAVAAVCIFRAKFSKGLLRSITRREWTIYSIRGIASYTIGVAGFTYAVQYTSLSVVSFIVALPILGLLAWILFREKLPTKSLLPIGLSVIGLGLLTGIDFGNLSLGAGEWAAIISMIGFDIGYLMSRMHDPRRNNFENTTILLLISWVPIFIISLIRHEGLLPHDLTVAACMGLLLSVVINIVGLYAINYVFTNLQAYVAGNILLLEGVFSIVLGLLFYGEPLVTSVITGGLLIAVSAIIINNISKTNQEVPDASLNKPE